MNTALCHKILLKVFRFRYHKLSNIMDDEETQTVVLSTSQLSEDFLSGTQTTNTTTTLTTDAKNFGDNNNYYDNNDSDDNNDESSDNSGDFTQYTRTIHKEKSKKLLNKVKATAYLMAAVDAKEKRKKREKKLVAEEKRKKTKLQKYANCSKTLLGNTNCVTEILSTTRSNTTTPIAAVHKTQSQSFPFATPSPRVTNSNASQNNKNLMNNTCSGCGRTVDECHETKYRYVCLHAVLDYFDEVGFRNVTQHGIYNSYARAYTFALKKDMLENTSFYERALDLEIPDCMENASLQDAQQINQSNCLFQFLMSKRVYDVEVYFERLKSGEIDAAFYSDVKNDNEED